MLRSRQIKNRVIDKWEHDLLLKVMERKVRGAKATIKKDQGIKRPSTHSTNVTWNLQGHKQPNKAHSAPNLSNAASTPKIISQSASVGALSPEVQRKVKGVVPSGGNYRASRGAPSYQKENACQILDLETLATIKLRDHILDDVVQELLNIREIDILSSTPGLENLSPLPHPNFDSPLHLNKDFAFQKPNTRPHRNNPSPIPKKQNSELSKRDLERLEKSWVVNWADKSMQEQVSNKFKKKNVVTPGKPIVKCC